jgi:hypothetical protein
LVLSYECEEEKTRKAAEKRQQESSLYLKKFHDLQCLPIIEKACKGIFSARLGKTKSGEGHNF